jgi:purine-cytosine permease-like protein
MAKMTPASEYEREPVPEKARKGPSSFWGMYAGEHTAGTEFMIGPLFIAWGVSAFDLIFGLLLGNLLAVLTWRYLTATIATRCRLTLYYQLEKICGRKLVSLYNLANGILFCFLAGAMVTVSATAVGVPFPAVHMPALNDTYPTGLAWCVVVLIIGSVMTFAAIRGYGFVAKVGQVAAPWLFLVFLACGIISLAQVGSLNIWELLDAGARPDAPIGFWGVVFFSWFCNAAMHLGMADLSVLRYARKPGYGWASAAGMFLGHYVAWICAALLLVAQVRLHGVDPAVGVAPGPMVFQAVGWAGLICVVIAGWTTANPTIYRAGLAFQGIAPRMSRVSATLIAGSICTLAGLFPAFAMNLLSFVGIYGTILAPVGAIITVEFFLFRRLNIQRNRAENGRLTFNWIVFASWIVPLIPFFYLRNHIFESYLTLPVYLVSGALYLVLAKTFYPSELDPQLSAQPTATK